MSVIKNPWGDKRDAAVSDESCFARSCLHVGEDKGVFVQGRGYTRYYAKPKLKCMTRELRGCPYPKPEADPEVARCCANIDFATPRKGRTLWRQTCRSCGAHASGTVLMLRRRLAEKDAAGKEEAGDGGAPQGQDPSQNKGLL